VLEPRIFPNGARVQGIRFARPTDQLERVTEFYREGLGLQVIGSFDHHAGYDGVMLGLPDASVQLEFTQHAHGSPCPAPTRDNLLVLYVQVKRTWPNFRVGSRHSVTRLSNPKTLIGPTKA